MPPNALPRALIPTTHHRPTIHFDPTPTWIYAIRSLGSRRNLRGADANVVKRRLTSTERVPTQQIRFRDKQTGGR